MCIRPVARGFTLIELVVFIVIVSVGLAGVLSVFNAVTKNSADPLRQKQALAAAESLLEEILNKNFSNPSGGYPANCPATCDRTQFDDVKDYDNYSRSGIRELTSDSSATAGTVLLSAYDVSVSVAASSSFTVGSDTVAPSDYRIVTVTVTDTFTGRSYSLSGYAFNNG